MKRTITLAIALIAGTIAYGQKAFMKRSKDSCHPLAGAAKRVSVIGAAGLNAPFNGIVHIGKNKGADWGTGAFITDNVIITARHVAEGLNNLELIQYTADQMIDLHFTGKDFTVYYDEANSGKTDHDLALIKINDKSKVKALANFIFKLQDVETLFPQITTEIHLTGFPFDQADKDQYRKPFPVDTLSDKSALINNVQFNTDRTMMGYPVYSCSGDSGAPVWVKIAADYYILGVHEGFKDGTVANNDLNLCTLVNKQEYNWIQTQLTH